MARNFFAEWRGEEDAQKLPYHFHHKKCFHSTIRFSPLSLHISQSLKRSAALCVEIRLLCSRKSFFFFVDNLWDARERKIHRLYAITTSSPLFLIILIKRCNFRRGAVFVLFCVWVNRPEISSLADLVFRSQHLILFFKIVPSFV